MNIRDIMSAAPVIPVLVIDDVDTAPQLAQALADGGLKVLEITLRTPQAFDAIDAIKSSVKDVIVGAGTVNSPDDVTQCKAHGVDFMVSPGLHSPLVTAALASGIPYLPGISTASDALKAIDAGLDSLKFFPAGQSGGPSMLKALNGPYQELRFCPTGGINAENFNDYLALPNVICVGGSWVAPSALVHKKNWQAIKDLAKTSCALANS